MLPHCCYSPFHTQWAQFASREEEQQQTFTEKTLLQLSHSSYQTPCPRKTIVLEPNVAIFSKCFHLYLGIYFHKSSQQIWEYTEISFSIWRNQGLKMLGNFLKIVQCVTSWLVSSLPNLCSKSLYCSYRIVEHGRLLIKAETEQN